MGEAEEARQDGAVAGVEVVLIDQRDPIQNVGIGDGEQPHARAVKNLIAQIHSRMNELQLRQILTVEPPQVRTVLPTHS